MRIWVAGAGGMLGQAVLSAADRRGWSVVGSLRSTLDLADLREVQNFAQHFGPFDHVVNCVAYTAVDRAESEPDEAHHTNAHIPSILASAGLPLVHISTDYAYGQGHTSPIPEGAPTNPMGVYARTKVEGDKEVLATGGTVVRTSWLFGPCGPSFLRTMTRLFGERAEVRVVNDQFGNPTYTPHLAAALLDFLSDGPTGGVRHLSGPESMSWFELASRWHALLRDRGFPMVCERISPIPTTEYPTPAPRPAYSVLGQTLPSLPPLEIALHEFSAILL